MAREPDPDCVFCKIVARDVPAEVVAETEQLLAFRDLNPQAPLHALVIPKAHIPTVNDLAAEEEGLVGAMVGLARDIAAKEGVSQQGYRLVLNCERGAGQTVFHIHLHLLAGRYLTWPPG